MGLALLFYILRLREAYRPPPVMGLSSLHRVKGVSPSLRLKFCHLPKRLFGLGLLCLCIAAVNPTVLVDPEEEAGDDRAENEPARQNPEFMELPREGLAIYLVLDQSGSMKQEVRLTTLSGRQVELSRMEALKQVVAQFIVGNRRAGLEGRRQDLLGLLSFARAAHVLAPLTLDHEYLLDLLTQLQPVRRVEEDGTGLGYAVYKTAHLISATRHFAQDLVDEGKPAYQIRDAVMIVVTDGFPNIHPEDVNNPRRSIELLDAAAYAAEQDIRMHIVAIEPGMQRPEYRAHTDSLRQSAQLTGGQLYLATSQEAVSEIFASLDGLEPSTVAGTERVQIRHRGSTGDDPLKEEHSLAPLFLGLALMGLFSSVVLETTYLRRAP
jgi:Ca-activated chloride channel family protein